MTLVAVAHGSADRRAAETTRALLRTVRARATRAGLSDLDVRDAYLGHAPPTVGEALAEIAGERLRLADGNAERPRQRRTRTAVVLPLLLTDAYHSRTDIPRLLRDARAAAPWLRIGYGRPLGPHPLLLQALERRLAEAAGFPADGDSLCGDAIDRGLPPRSTAIVLAAAGSSDPAANTVIGRVAARWRALRGWRAVLPAYASAASPRPGEAVTMALRGGARRVIVASYLLAPGSFADQIRRESLAAGAAAVTGVLGAVPEVADVVLDRYTEALAATGACDQAVAS